MNGATIRATRQGDVIKDDLVPGLQLRAFARSRRWYLYYRTAAGTQRRPKLGTWPAMTLQQARGVAKQWLADVQRGKDPSRQRKVDRSAETIGDLCDRFVADYLEELGRDPGYIAASKSRIENIIRPKWGRLRPAELTAADVMTVRRSMKATPYTFNRLRSLIRKILNWGKVVPNIITVDDVPPYRERKRRRYLTPGEYHALARALDALEAEAPADVAVIRLIALTGARPAEILLSHQAWRVGHRLTLPEHKTDEAIGDKVIILPPAAVAILDGLEAPGPYLCGRSSFPRETWNRAVEIAKLANVRPYDLRHSFASVGLSEGSLTLAQLGELYGHTTPATTARYAHLIDSRKIEIANDMGSRIGAAMAEKKSPAVRGEVQGRAKSGRKRPRRAYSGGDTDRRVSRLR